MNPDRLATVGAGLSFEAITTQAVNITTFGSIKAGVRCDDATLPGRGGFTKPACIYIVKPGWFLNANDNGVAGAAKHIRDAITNPNSTLPPDEGGTVNKIIPSENRRTTDGNLNDAQRRKSQYACDKWLDPRPTDPYHQCDEYPPAATYNGSLSPDNDYSVRWVLKEHNETEGSRRGVWYKDDRILDGDWYSVGVYDGEPVG